ncbi:MAG: hypothetical protein JO136_03375 [Hyphomicrobiales bacterium]|jgi:hypothetical protein|nr:hypothetical protein [Hyphomicrobiales bacterium]MBV9907852.1 hypothetical protein [Hyphomicrobiales bacterium]
MTLIASSSDKHFLHSSVVLRHANGESGEAEQHIETILTEAAVHKRRVWVSSVLFAQLRPSTFVPGRFATLFELTRYIRALATLVTPDPNAMLRVARLRDARWQMSADRNEKSEKSQAMSLGDAMEISSALWVKEAIGVPDLEFLTFDNWCAPDGEPGNRLCLLHLQDYAVDVGANADVKAAVRLTRLEPLVHAQAYPDSVPVG